MSGSYSAPLGIAARPFQPGGTFPGAPPFATPNPVAQLGSTGFPVSLGPQPGGSGIRGFAAGVFRPNRVVDWTNGQVAYHYVVTPDQKHDEAKHRLANVGIGMMCFARDMSLDIFNGPAGKGLVGEAFKPYFGPGERTERTVEVFEITALNEFLRSQKGSGSKSCRISDAFETARQVIESFPLLGVVITEVAPANDSNYGSRPSTRVINFAVRGRCQTFNLWSGKRPAGTPAFLLVKKVQHGESMVWAFEPYPSPEAPSLPERGVDYHSPRPPPEALTWIEKGKNGKPDTVGVGEAIFVGTMGHNVGDIALDPHRELWKQGLFKTGNHTMPPTTELFLRV